VNPATESAATFQQQVDGSNKAAIAAVHAKADNAGGGQTSLLQSAEEANQLGASQAATVGALFCAHGANQNLVNPEGAANDYASCTSYFTAAQAMRGKGPPYIPDSATLRGGVARETLASFEKNFGITGDTFMSKLLSANGSRDAFAEMVS